MLIGRFLQAPLGRVRCVLVRSLSPGPTVSAVCCPSSAGNLTAALRTLSNVSSLPARGTSPRLSGARVLLGPVTVLRSGARAMSGSSPGSDSWGWYGSLAESGPVRLCEQYLVGVQQLTGFPWWLSIIVSTVTVRTLITLPLAAYQVVIIAKVEALQAEISELAKRLRYEVSVRAKERGWTEKEKRFQFQRNLRHLVSQLYIRDNCHPFKASLLVWVQLPLWISLSLALRNLSLEEPGCSGSRRGPVVPGPDLPRPHLDPTAVSGTHQPAHRRGVFFTETPPVSSPEAHHQLHPGILSLDGSGCSFSSVCHGPVLVVLQPGGILSQPAPAVSYSPQRAPAASAAFTHSLQRPAGSLRQQVLQVAR
ncbi:unnamed protein product [Tetraodon nigroviridis]|uniref:(spotted green pufferfish) hypothetical protein n=1 Tax=Tetraodon nigroviridis TaxID=99883 RepID=Q4T1Y2_TETNG|nr:unnamed protein product [Tetraodon nigroviridis]